MSLRKIKKADNENNLVICIDPVHNLPKLFMIKPGEIWEHICPSCGTKTIVTVPNLI
jgi:hypothetical protein